MTEIEKIILTSAFTICGGVLVIVSGQVFIRFFLDPITELRKLFGEISDALIYYANVYSNPGVAREDIINSAKKAFRENASLLHSKAHALPFYPLFSIVRLVPRRKNIGKASQNFIGLSNSLIQGDPSVNHKRADEIRDALGLPDE